MKIEDLATAPPAAVKQAASRNSVEALVNLERNKRYAKRFVDAEERPKSNPPEILTLRERLARPQPAVTWRIARLQAVGHRVLLAAQFKAGKTTFVGNLMHSLVDGDVFLNTFDVAPIDGTVCLLDFEMSSIQLDKWHRDIAIANDDRVYPIHMKGAASQFNIIDPEVRAYWVDIFKSRNVKYLIVDCLRPVLDALGLNEHTETGLFLTALDALLREADIPEALVIQHMGHANERARGDSRLLDWPDVGWTMVRESEDDPASPRFFKAYGRDVDEPETELTYCPTTRRLSVEGGGSRADAKIAAALVDVCAFVSKAETPPSGNQIEKGVKALSDHAQATIRKAIHRGAESGALVQGSGKNGGSIYTVETLLLEANEVEKWDSGAGNEVDDDHGM
jgi:AAA domain